MPAAAFSENSTPSVVFFFILTRVSGLIPFSAQSIHDIPVA